MKINLYEITIRDVTNGFKDSAENGVIGYGGKLNIRPAFQREFVYNGKQRDDVLVSIMHDFPLNVMYWVLSSGKYETKDKTIVPSEDASFELLDGQQRTLSICQYVNGDFSLNSRYFHNLTKPEQEQILDYKLMIYVCEGNDKEKLDWFRVINHSTEELSDQELRNAIYTGPFISDAKRYFSKTGCAAYQIAGDYMSGKVNRQEYLETAIKWLAAKEDKSIEDYIAEHQHDANANALWLYFQQVISWVKVVFPKYRKEMKGLSWGIYFNKYGSNSYDSAALEARIVELMEDEEVTNNKGIYEYLLSGNEKSLSLRTFPDKIKRAIYEKQGGKCAFCGQPFPIERMQGDHIIAWSNGGTTVIENCQMLCAQCNGTKSNK